MKPITLCLILAPVLLSRAAELTPEQIRRCAALQFLLNPPPSVEMRAVFWAGLSTNLHSWRAEGEAWQCLSSSRDYDAITSLLGWHPTGSFHGTQNLTEGWGDIYHDTRASALTYKARYDGRYHGNNSVRQLATLGLTCVAPGDLTLTNGQLVSKVWITNGWDLSTARGEITLDDQGRLKRIKWRYPGEFAPNDWWREIEYHYSGLHTVPEDLPTGWSVRINSVEHGPSSPESTAILYWRIGDRPNPDRLHPDNLTGFMCRFRETESGEYELVRGRWILRLPRKPSTPSSP